MTTSVKLLFDKIMSDPDIVTPAGEDKSEAALAIAQQRVKQADNNRRALNMAKAYPNASALTKFLRAQKDLQLQKADKGGWSENAQREWLASLSEIDKNTGTYGIEDVEIQSVLEAVRDGQGDAQFGEPAKTDDTRFSGNIDEFESELEDAMVLRQEIADSIAPTDSDFRTMARARGVTAGEAKLSEFITEDDGISRKEFDILDGILARVPNKNDKLSILENFLDGDRIIERIRNSTSSKDLGAELQREYSFTSYNNDFRDPRVSKTDTAPQSAGGEQEELAGGATSQTNEETDLAITSSAWEDVTGPGAGQEANDFTVNPNVAEVSNTYTPPVTETKLNAAPNLKEYNPEEKNTTPLTNEEKAVLKELLGLAWYKRTDKNRNGSTQGDLSAYTLNRMHSVNSKGEAKMSHMFELLANLSRFADMDFSERQLYDILQTLQDKDYVQFSTTGTPAYWKLVKWDRNNPASWVKNSQGVMSTVRRSDYNDRPQIDINTIKDSEGHTRLNYFAQSTDSVIQRDDVIPLPDGTYGKVLDSQLNTFNSINSIFTDPLTSKTDLVDGLGKAYAFEDVTGAGDAMSVPIQHTLYQKSDGGYGFGTFAYNHEEGIFEPVFDFESSDTSGITHSLPNSDYETVLSAYVDNLNVIKNNTDIGINKSAIRNKLDELFIGEKESLRVKYNNLSSAAQNNLLEFITDTEQSGLELKIRNPAKLGKLSLRDLENLSDEELDNYETSNSYQKEFIDAYKQARDTFQATESDAVQFTEEDAEIWTADQYRNFVDNMTDETDDETQMKISDEQVKDFYDKITQTYTDSDGNEQPVLTIQSRTITSPDGTPISSNPYKTESEDSNVFDSYFDLRLDTANELGIESFDPRSDEPSIIRELNNQFGNTLTSTLDTLKNSVLSGDATAADALAKFTKVLNTFSDNESDFQNPTSEAFTKLSETLTSKAYLESGEYNVFFPIEKSALGPDWDNIDTNIQTFESPFNKAQEEAHLKNLTFLEAQKQKEFEKGQRALTELTNTDIQNLANSIDPTGTITPSTKNTVSPEAIAFKELLEQKGKAITSDSTLSDVEKIDRANEVFADDELKTAYENLPEADQAWFIVMGRSGFNIRGLAGVDFFRDSEGNSYQYPMQNIAPVNRTRRWYQDQALQDVAIRNADGAWTWASAASVVSDRNLEDVAKNKLQTALSNIPNFNEFSKAVEQVKGNLAVSGDAVRNAYADKAIESLDIELHGLNSETSLLSESAEHKYALQDNDGNTLIPLIRSEGKAENVFSTEDGTITFTIVPQENNAVDMETTSRAKSFTADSLIYDIFNDRVLDPSNRAMDDIDANRLGIVDNTNIINNEMSPYEAAVLMSQFNLTLPSEHENTLANVVTNVFDRSSNVDNDANKTLAFFDILRASNSQTGLNTLKKLGAFKQDFPTLHELGDEEWDTLVQGVSSVSSDFTDGQTIATLFNYLKAEDVESILNPVEGEDTTIFNNDSMIDAFKDGKRMHEITQAISASKDNNNNLRKVVHSYSNETNIENALQVLQATKLFNTSDINNFKTKVDTYKASLNEMGVTQNNALLDALQITNLLDLANVETARNIQDEIINHQINNSLTSVQEAENYVRDNYERKTGEMLSTYQKPEISNTDILDITSQTPSNIEQLNTLVAKYGPERNEDNTFKEGVQGIKKFRNLLEEAVKTPTPELIEFLKTHKDKPFTRTSTVGDKWTVVNGLIVPTNSIKADAETSSATSTDGPGADAAGADAAGADAAGADAAGADAAGADAAGAKKETTAPVNVEGAASQEEYLKNKLPVLHGDGLSKENYETFLDQLSNSFQTQSQQNAVTQAETAFNTASTAYDKKEAEIKNENEHYDETYITNLINETTEAKAKADARDDFQAARNQSYVDSKGFSTTIKKLNYSQLTDLNTLLANDNLDYSKAKTKISSAYDSATNNVNAAVSDYRKAIEAGEVLAVDVQENNGKITSNAETIALDKLRKNRAVIAKEMDEAFATYENSTEYKNPESAAAMRLQLQEYDSATLGHLLNSSNFSSRAIRQTVQREWDTYQKTLEDSINSSADNPREASFAEVLTKLSTAKNQTQVLSTLKNNVTTEAVAQSLLDNLESNGKITSEIKETVSNKISTHFQAVATKQINTASQSPPQLTNKNTRDFSNLMYDYNAETRPEGFKSSTALDALFNRGWSKSSTNPKTPYGTTLLKSPPGTLYEILQNQNFMDGINVYANSLLAEAEEGAVTTEELSKRLVLQAYVDVVGERNGQSHDVLDVIKRLQDYGRHDIDISKADAPIVSKAFAAREASPTGNIKYNTEMRIAEHAVKQVYGNNVTITPGASTARVRDISGELGYDRSAGNYNSSEFKKFTNKISEIKTYHDSGERASYLAEAQESNNYSTEELNQLEYSTPTERDTIVRANQKLTSTSLAPVSHERHLNTADGDTLPNAGDTFSNKIITNPSFKNKAKHLLNNERFMKALNSIANHAFANFTDEQISNSGTQTGDKSKRVNEYSQLMLRHAIKEAASVHGVGTPSSAQIMQAIESQARMSGIPKEIMNKAFDSNIKKIINSQVGMAEDISTLRSEGFTTSKTAQQNPELTKILEMSDIHNRATALKKFTSEIKNTSEEIKTPAYRAQVREWVKNNPEHPDVKRLQSGKNFTKKEADKLMDTHSKETLASEQRASQTNRDFARKDADQINSRIIDPDISPEDATEQYKEIHELVGQHDEHLTASQRKKLLDRASSLKNDYNAYTTQIDAAINTNQRIKDSYDDWLRENPSATTAEKRRYKQDNPNYIGSDAYHNDLAAPVSSEVGNHETETEKHSTGIKEAQSSQRAMDAEYDVTNGDEHRANRSLAAKHGGYNSFVKVGTDGKATHTVLKGADGRSTTVTEKNGRHEAHHDDYSDFGHPEAKNKYNADNKDARPDNIGYHPELSGDTLLAGAAKQYAQARKDHEDSAVNSPERASAERTINAIEKSHPQIKDIFNGMKERGTHLDSKTAMEEARKSRGDAPTAAPVSKETGEVLVWAPGIGHWVLPETLQRLNSDPNYQQGLLMKQADFIKHLQGDLKQDKHGNYLDANDNVIPNFNPLTDKSHTGDVYIHGKSGQVIGVNRNSDGSKELSHHEALSAGLGKVANKIGGEAESFTKNADGSFSGGTHMHDAETAHIGHLDHIGEQLSRSMPKQSLQSRLNRSMAQSTAEGFKGVMMDRNNPLGAVMRTAAPLVVATGIADRVAGMAKKFNLV